jgi:hypothetical protein
VGRSTAKEAAKESGKVDAYEKAANQLESAVEELELHEYSLHSREGAYGYFAYFVAKGASGTCWSQPPTDSIPLDQTRHRPVCDFVEVAGCVRLCVSTVQCC